MKLFVGQSALAELQDAAAFYAAKGSAELGQAFVSEFERTVNLILGNPLLGAVFRGDRRRFSLRRFPYSVIYQITSEEIRVVAVAHQRRRPGYWAKRE